MSFYIIFLLSITNCESQETIDQIMRTAYADGKFNGSVLVVKNDKTLFERSFGYADGAKTTKLSKEHRFGLGSIVKEFPAVAIMQLQEQQLIDLNDQLSKYLPKLPVWAESISIKQLLQYSSGLPMVRWDHYFGQGLPVTNEDVWADLMEIEKLEFEAGSDYLYTNYSPVLLIEIVEQVSKTNFQNYLSQNIFSTCKMENVVVHDGYPFQSRSLMAAPFNEAFEEDNYELKISNLLLTANARDVYNWVTCLGNFEIVDKISIEYLSKTAQNKEGRQAPLGVVKWKNDKMILHEHHGSMANYECLVRRLKQDELTVVILTNQKNGNVHELADRIIQSVDLK